MINEWFKHPLYRIPERGKVFGICAGIAHSIEQEVWLVRVAVIILTIVSGVGPMVAAYIIAFLVLEPVPYGFKNQRRGANADYDTRTKINRRVDELKQAVYGKAAKSHSIQDISKSLEQARRRVERIEAYVTSEHYRFQREFNDLDK
ncbi:MAG: PspC domain-containing protein [Kangiellaceae bacterium]|jgi:phage shock protein C|nr:PspC domain-containing protein [Kangiellaceae bacterium]